MMSEQPTNQGTVTLPTMPSENPFHALGEGIRYLTREPRWLALFLLALLLLVQPTIWLMSTWFNWHSAFFAQPLVLLGAFLIGYSRRVDVKKTYEELLELFLEDSPKRRGNLLGIIMGGMIAFIGHLLRMDFVAILGFVIVVNGIIFYFYGPFILRAVFPALLFLCFLIPLPKTIVNLFQIGFQNATYSFLSPIFKTNSFTIEMPNFLMPIDALASGLHLFIPLFIFAVGWALYKRYRFSNILVMLTLAILGSLFINVIRVMITCWIGSANPDIGNFMSHSSPLLWTLPVGWLIIIISRWIHQRQELHNNMRSSANA